MSDLSATLPGATGVTLVVNGEPLRCDASSTVATLLERRALTSQRVAVECNGAIVPRSRHAETRLQDGDRIEIVVAVGGG